MSAEAASSISEVTVHVRLLDEGIQVFRPTQAVVINPKVYQLLPTHDYDPEDEHWEFLPGSKVRAEIRTGAEGNFLLATAAAI